MDRPMIAIPDNVPVTDIKFVSGHPTIQFDHTEGYWLLFRKPIYKLHDNFVFSFVSGGVRYTVTLRAGFLTDLASTPKAIWWLFPPFDSQWGMPALAHDGLYAGEIVSRLKADQLLKDGMEICAARLITRFLFFSAVRDWGWLVWSKHTDITVAGSRKHIDVLEEKI